MTEGMRGSRPPLPRRRHQHVLPDRSRGAVPRQRPRRRDRRARRARRRRAPDRAHLVRRPRSARKAARSAPRRARTEAATCRSTSAPSTRARSRRSPPRRTPGSSLSRSCRRPSRVPGRAGGTGRILIAYLNGKLKAFVDTRISLVDIDDTIEAHVLAAERGKPGERYLISGATITSLRGAGHRERDRRRAPRRPAAPRRPSRARVGGAVEVGFRAREQEAAGVPRDDPHAAARPPLRRLLRRRRARAAATRRWRTRCAARSSGRVRKDSCTSERGRVQLSEVMPGGNSTVNRSPTRTTLITPAATTTRTRPGRSA